MRAYCVLLHVFAALLLCEYGMFSTPPPSPTEMFTAAISETSDPNTTAMAMTNESTTTQNDPSSSDLDSGDDQSNVSFTGDPKTTEVYPSTGNKSGIGVPSSSTAQPEKDSKQTVSTSNTGDSNTGNSNTAPIIFLILILILIAFLLGILYFLRKKGRSYSFDLTRVEVPASDYVDTPLRSDQQGISYEQTNKDLPVCMDYEQEDKSEEKSTPIGNGSAGEKTEQTPTSENDEENFPEENSFSSDSSLATPGYIKKVEFNLDLDLLGGESDSNDSKGPEATDVAQNENNNNISNAGRGTADEIFTEISLDEPK